MPARRAVPFCTLLAATALWLVFGAVVVVNYDTLYAILWGNQLLHGQAPELTAAGAPTPHPLLTLLGVIAAPIAGHGSATGLAVVAFAGYLATVACAVLLVVVGRRSLGPVAGAIAAAFLLTREPVLSYGLRAYIDLPYLALLLAAVGLELSRPRRGQPCWRCSPSPACCGPRPGCCRPRTPYGWRGRRTAGSARRRPARTRRRRARALGGDRPAAHRQRALLVRRYACWAERLERPTGLSGLLTIAPRRIGEILRVDGLAGAVIGAALLMRRRPRGAGVVAIATLVAAAAFAFVALGGLPVIVRYLLPFGAAGCLAYGWALSGGGRSRRFPSAASGPDSPPASSCSRSSSLPHSCTA